jgi:nanoRNase/pAp phosphatase (c-di-AMP/oligoRNAs hydrolase)
MTKQELEVNLHAMLKGKCKGLIITYENTYPDGIAAAFGFKCLSRTAGVSSYHHKE